MILFAAVSITYAAVRRFIAPEPLGPPGPGVRVALLAAAVNYPAGRVIRKVTRKHASITIKADAKHRLSEVWISVGFVTGLLVIVVMPSRHILDLVAAIAGGYICGLTGTVSYNSHHG